MNVDTFSVNIKKKSTWQGGVRRGGKGDKHHLDFCVQFIFQQQAGLVLNRQIVNKFFDFWRQSKICWRTSETVGNQPEESRLFDVLAFRISCKWKRNDEKNRT